MCCWFGLLWFGLSVVTWLVLWLWACELAGCVGIASYYALCRVLCRAKVVFVFVVGTKSYPSVAQLVERSTVVVDTVRGILRNRLVTSSILVVRTCPFIPPFFCFSLYLCSALL